MVPWFGSLQAPVDVGTTSGHPTHACLSQKMAPIELSSIMVNTMIFYSKKETTDLSKIQNIKF